MTDQLRIAVGERVLFDGKRTVWLARAESADGRYTLLTASMFGNVYYTLVDWEHLRRGRMNVIGGGLGIFTTSGPDPAIDEAMDMLLPHDPIPEGVTSVPYEPRGFGLSTRGGHELRITDRLI